MRRWLREVALKPWQSRSQIFIRDPDFRTVAQRVLDLYARTFEGIPLGKDEFVLSCDEKDLDPGPLESGASSVALPQCLQPCAGGVILPRWRGCMRQAGYLGWHGQAQRRRYECEHGFQISGGEVGKATLVQSAKAGADFAERDPSPPFRVAM